MLSTIAPTMPHLVVYFQVHQPRRLTNFSFFDIGGTKPYFDDELNQDIMTRIAFNCYLPTNRMLLKLIASHPGIKVNFSISGTALEQMELYAPEALESFQALASTGSVEFFAETSHHSLAALISEDEFAAQVAAHRLRTQQLFNQTPRIARNTELIYNDRIGDFWSRHAFDAVIAEVKSSEINLHEGEIFTHPRHPSLRLLLRANELSDAISFRYLQGKSRMTVKKYIRQLYQAASHRHVILLGMDYETFGEHYKASTGIVDFLRDFLLAVERDKCSSLAKASEVISSLKPVGPLSVPSYASWADESKDLSAWLGNDLQKGAFTAVRRLEQKMKEEGEADLIEKWRHLQTSDHFYYMCTKAAADGEVHSYFSHYVNPYEAYINFMNVIKDLETKIGSLKTTKGNDETTEAFALSPGI